MGGGRGQARRRRRFAAYVLFHERAQNVRCTAVRTRNFQPVSGFLRLWLGCGWRFRQRDGVVPAGSRQMLRSYAIVSHYIAVVAFQFVCIMQYCNGATKLRTILEFITCVCVCRILEPGSFNQENAARLPRPRVCNLFL